MASLPATTRVENITPVLPVSNLATALRFYREQFGFTIDWGEEPGETVAGIHRDGKGLMLRETADPRPALVWIGVEDIVPFIEIARRLNLDFVQEPTNHPWAYDAVVKDPDGNMLWFGSGPLEDPT